VGATSAAMGATGNARRDGSRSHKPALASNIEWKAVRRARIVASCDREMPLLVAS